MLKLIFYLIKVLYMDHDLILYSQVDNDIPVQHTYYYNLTELVYQIDNKLSEYYRKPIPVYTVYNTVTKTVHQYHSQDKLFVYNDTEVYQVKDIHQILKQEKTIYINDIDKEWLSNYHYRYLITDHHCPVIPLLIAYEYFKELIKYTLCSSVSDFVFHLESDYSRYLNIDKDVLMDELEVINNELNINEYLDMITRKYHNTTYHIHHLELNYPYIKIYRGLDYRIYYWEISKKHHKVF